MTSFVFSKNKPPSYIVGLAYNQLAGRNINVVVSATISNNRALIIKMHRAYYPNRTINIAEPGGEKIIKLIIGLFKTLKFTFALTLLISMFFMQDIGKML